MARKKIRVKPQEHGFAINLMQHLVIPTFVIDAQRRVMIWNKACERLTGVPAEELVGTSEHWRAFYEKPRPCLADILVMDCVDKINEFYIHHHTVPSVLNHGLRVENWCVMPRMGQQLYLAIDAGPIYDEAGNVLAVVETLRDITEHKRAQIALQQLATQDGLTNLMNRRAFDENLKIEWQRSARQGMPLSLIMIDVDQFKLYNDHYGHTQGDECLKKVASVMLKGSGRATDLVSRYGGEEFALILPNTDIEGGITVGKRIRDAIMNLRIPHEKNSVEGGIVTVSVGVACLIPEEHMQPESVIESADMALYKAKKAGRNCVVAS